MAFKYSGLKAKFSKKEWFEHDYNWNHAARIYTYRNNPAETGQSVCYSRFCFMLFKQFENRIKTTLYSLSCYLMNQIGVCLGCCSWKDWKKTRSVHKGEETIIHESNEVSYNNGLQIRWLFFKKRQKRKCSQVDPYLFFFFTYFECLLAASRQLMFWFVPPMYWFLPGLTKEFDRFFFKSVIWKKILIYFTVKIKCWHSFNFVIISERID